VQAILFQLKKLGVEQESERRKWESAAYEIEQLQPKTGTASHSLKGVLLILDGNESPLLSKAINHAASRHLSYSLTFFEKATVWNYDPPTVAGQ
jgi:hypothetical protein